MSRYSVTDKTLHKLYLGNHTLSRAALEMEEILHGKKARQIPIKEFVFVTGLARSGTTAVMRQIFATGEYASLQYSNMPFILNPNIWNKASKIQAHERAHKDGIVVDGNSPEEFDEFFWKVHTKDGYIQKDGLAVHELDRTLLNKYQQYVQLICLAKKKNKYVSKNNNNILRINGLRKIEGSKIITLFREPISHASSLLKLHKRFSLEQKQDPFTLLYFDYLGHHEFGLHHKPFLLTKELELIRKKYDLNSINYWLGIWFNYYSYAQNILEDSDILLRFEDVITKPQQTYSALAKKLELKTSFPNVKSHKPSDYTNRDIEEELLSKCLDIYHNLMSKRTY